MKKIKITSQALSSVIEKTADFIKNGKIVVCPTDTVYGLICDATNEKAVRRLFKIKKRPKGKPTPVFVKDIKMAKKLAKIDKKQEEFLKSVWPGRVTAVLERKKIKTKLYGVDKKTIALRVPNFKLINFLLEKLNKPLVETSANISGKPASTKIKKVLAQFKNRASKRSESEDEDGVLTADKKYQPDLIIDAGNLKLKKPSKVLDLTISPPRLLRL